MASGKDEKGDAAFRASDFKSTWHEPAYSGALSFMRRRYMASAAGADVAILGVPLDIATSYRPGTRFGPQAIRRISALYPPSDPAWPHAINPLEILSIVDLGDVVWDYAKPATIITAIERRAGEVLDHGATLIALGGDHFITYPLLKAHAARHGALALIQFDAHQDTWGQDTWGQDSWGETKSDPDGGLDHGNFVLRAVSEGLIDPERSIQIGIRTIAPTTAGIAIFDADRIAREGVAAAIAAIRARIGQAKAYLTFDIDCLDPAFAPGTGTPVPGGLMTREALAILRGISDLDIVGFDLVEVSPPYDHCDITANAAVAILQHWLCQLALHPRHQNR